MVFVCSYGCGARMLVWYWCGGGVSALVSWSLVSSVCSAHGDAQIGDILARGKRPIIVGGSHQYLEALLWLADPAAAPLPAVPSATHDRCTISVACIHAFIHDRADLIDIDWTDQAIYERLREVDPERAQQLHPNDRKRVQRSVEVGMH